MLKGWYSGLNTQYIPGDSTYYVHLEHLQRLVIQVVCPGHFNPKKCPCLAQHFLPPNWSAGTQMLPSWFPVFWWILRDNPNELCQLWKTGVQQKSCHTPCGWWISSFSDRCFLLVPPFHPTSLSGWWLTYPSEKYEFVSWDHYSQYMQSHNPAMFQTTNQLCLTGSMLQKFKIVQATASCFPQPEPLPPRQWPNDGWSPSASRPIRRSSVDRPLAAVVPWASTKRNIDAADIR